VSWVTEKEAICSAHNSEVAGSANTPATTGRRFRPPLAYAQAADQPFWVGGLSFMGTICGDLLNSCRMQRMQGARARQSRHAAPSRLKVGGEGALHRARLV
jgi:hypothetical protein